jgi:CRISPR system Cascade subunit CasA
MAESKITFNLWTEPWISLEKEKGGIEQLSIQDTLKYAQDYRAIYETSPLVVVGIHRLLVAILQFILNPQENNDLKKLWRTEKFPFDAIEYFGKEYAHRFDLFSEEEPFLQSADLPTQPGKKDAISYVSRLTYDIPSGSYVTHYHHGNEKEIVFCPACVAKHLVTIPAFASSGGAGIKPSINGVPPIYVIPDGKNLFASLTASLVCPSYQPEIRSKQKDNVWWEHRPEIGLNEEIREIGYCQSLTFPARRIRVHPHMDSDLCTRCGAETEITVNTIVLEMGETRPINAEVWFDPFVAYVFPGEKKTKNRKGENQSFKKSDMPISIRPNYRRKAWAIWREFAGLFLLETKVSGDRQNKTYRPRIIQQFLDLELPNQQTLAFRCVSLMTDNKGKIFSWMDARFDIPPMALKDENAGYNIRRAVGVANECGNEINRIFLGYFRRAKSKQHEVVSNRMTEIYWDQLAEPFRYYVLLMNSPRNYDNAQKSWADLVVSHARGVFNQAARSLGDDSERLAQHAKAEKELNIQLLKKRKEFLNE